MHLLAFIILLLFSSLNIFYDASADQEAEARQKLQKLAAEISKIEQNIAKNSQDQKKLERDMQTLDRQIGRLHVDIRRLNQKVASAQQRSQQLSDKQTELHQELTDQGRAFSQQARMAYLSQRQSKWKLMLTQNSPQDAGRMAAMYDYVNQARLDQIGQLNQLAERIQQNQVDLATAQARMQKLIQQQNEQKSILQQARNHKQQAQQALVQLIDQDQSRLKQAQQNQRAIKKLLGKLQKNSNAVGGAFATQKGSLTWPVKGKLLNRYGSAKNGSSTIAWDGVSIRAARGSDVRAIYPGNVVFSDWFQGYGWLLIIDHGNEFMSLYAHAESLHKNVGDAVKQGEKIAIVGDSGGAPQPSLYFEIRRQGVPVNPAEWCTVPKLAYSS